MDPRTYNIIATCGGYFHTLMTPTTKEVIADVACGSARVNWTHIHVIGTGRDSTTPYDTCIAIRSTWDNFPVLIVSPTEYPSCGISGILQVGKKQQSTSPEKICNAQKLDTAIDRKLPDDQDAASILSKVISCELSHHYSDNLYWCCRMNFSSNVVQTEALQFVNLRILAVNASNEFGILGTSTSNIRRPTDVSNWSAPDHVSGEATAVGIIVAGSDQNYSYNTAFEIWRENQDFGHQNISIS